MSVPSAAENRCMIIAKQSSLRLVIAESLFLKVRATLRGEDFLHEPSSCGVRTVVVSGKLPFTAISMCSISHQCRITLSRIIQSTSIFCFFVEKNPFSLVLSASTLGFAGITVWRYPGGKFCQKVVRSSDSVIIKSKYIHFPPITVLTPDFGRSLHLRHPVPDVQVRCRCYPACQTT